MKKPMKQSQKTFALWFLLVIMFLAMLKWFEQSTPGTVEKPFTEFMSMVKDKNVSNVIFKGENKIIWETKDDQGNPVTYVTIGDTRSEFYLKSLQENGIVPDYELEEGTPVLQQIFISWFPMLLLFLVFIFFMRQIQIGGGKAMSFGKSKAKLLDESQQKITFKDVAGVDEAKEELNEVVEFLKDPKKFTRLGGRLPKGLLLMGPPGTGKTLLARAIAGEAGVPFFCISGSDFVEMFVGVGASRVRDLFEQGKKHAPCIIFIDEIDAVGRHRGAGLGGGHDEREQTLNQLLVEMDGFEGNDGVILIAATNRPDVLDPALLRPGRFDRRVTVGRPDIRGREEIFAVHTRKIPMSSNVDLKTLARGTPGMSGADIENLVNEAALYAARENKNYVEMNDFEFAKDKVLMGSERRSIIISDDEKKNTAYHEAGHTLVGKLIPGLDPIHKVTIVPRGQALGVTQTLPEDNQLSLSKEKAANTIAFLMGGRIAEELIFGHTTTGAGNDIERATKLAHSMVCEWGMSDALGPITFGEKEHQPFLGMEFSKNSSYSEATAESIDKEIKKIVDTSYKKAKELVTKNKKILVDLAEALLEYEVLDSAQVDAIVKGEPMPSTPVAGNSTDDPSKKENSDSSADKAKDDKNEGNDPIGSGNPLIA